VGRILRGMNFVRTNLVGTNFVGTNFAGTKNPPVDSQFSCLSTHHVVVLVEGETDSITHLQLLSLVMFNHNNNIFTLSSVLQVLTKFLRYSFWFFFGKVASIGIAIHRC